LTTAAYAYRDRRTQEAHVPLSLADPHQRRRPRRRLTYSRFMEGLKAAKCALDRKVIADLAATDAAAFGEIINMAKAALKAKPAATLAKA
jgi:large subunit ribosomal protein L20